ncbi:MAG TPA: phospholipid scramblase-related protein [Acidimicrobiales bacterium]|nr:phospholipid scramblase-related protein [Acidimicrobiales bacterium]
MPALLDHDLLVISQKAKLIELTNEYRVRDEHGTDVGLIRQEGQSKTRKLLRLVTSVDQFLGVSLMVYDADGRAVVGLRRPPKLLKSRIEVTDGAGAVVGRIVQQNVVGRIRFALEDADGGPLGEIRAENWRAWDFSVVGPDGTEVGRVTKKWAGLGHELLTTADNYVLEIRPGVAGPLRLLLLAAAAGIDTALKQDSN